MSLDSHLIEVTTGCVLSGGYRDWKDDGWQLSLRTSKGAFRLKACSLKHDGIESLAPDPDDEDSEPENLIEYFQDALISKITVDDEIYSLHLIALAGESLLTGKNISWSKNGRPPINLVTSISTAVTSLKDCGCVLNKEGQEIEWCREHAPKEGENIPYQKVDGGEITVEAGECSECNDLVKIIGEWSFSQCSFISD